MSSASTTFANDCCGTAAGRNSSGGMWWRIAASAFLAINSMTVALVVNLSEVNAHERFLLQSIPLSVALIVFLLLGGPLLSAAWTAWRARRLSIESLFLLSIIGAFAASLMSFVNGTGPIFFEVVSILLVVYALGKELGRYGRDKVLEALGRWDPALLSCEVAGEDGQWREALVSEIQAGQRVRVHPGAVIPVDGFVFTGESFVHEATITGEGFAASRRPGDHVLAGTHVVDSTLVIEAQAAGTLRCIDRISDALKESIHEPGASQVAANHIMQWFVPAVAATALVTFGLHTSLHGWQAGLFNAMAVLLIACPCSLGFATPIAAWTAMRRLNSFGMVTMTGSAIEKLAATTYVAFDKTGTLTLPDATPELHLNPPWQTRRAFVEQLISAAETAVEHPIAKALRPLAQVKTFEARSVRIEPGLGIAAQVESDDGTLHHVRIIRSGGSPQELHHRLSVEIDGEQAAFVLLRETQRPLIAETAAKLKEMDIRSVLVTGDGLPRAALLPFTERLCGLTPEQKWAVVREKKAHGETVLFVGDGINDAAAMAASDTSIAIGCESLTREVADIEWSEPDIANLPKAIALCRQTVRLNRANLVFALCYNIAGMAMAAAGWIHPVVAALLMTTSSCIVTFRSLQLLESELQ